MIRASAAFVFSAILGACASEASREPIQPEVYVDHFTHKGFGIPLTSFVKPAGEYRDGVTYVAYQGLLEDPYIAAYDHRTKSWTGPIKVGVSDLGKNGKKKIDNHGQPALLIDDEGYIHIAFGGHGGTEKLGKNALGNYNDGKMKHVVSKKPLDISSWEELHNISPFGTYTQWVKMDNGDIYLFYRHGAHRSDWVYQKSTDNGRTFQAPVSILKTRPSKDFDGQESWYGWFTKAEGDKIIATINFHICQSTSKINGLHRGERRDGYYMYLDTQTGKWHNVQGETLMTPLTKQVADEKTFAFDSGDEWTHTEAVQLDSLGYPHMTIRKGADIGAKHGGPKKMHFVRWTGHRWVETQEQFLPVSKGDLKVNTQKDITLWLAGKNHQGDGELALWRSTNAGKTFDKERVLYRVDNANLIVSSFVRNAHPDAQIIAAEEVEDTPLRRMYLIGINGPVKRPAAEIKH